MAFSTFMQADKDSNFVLLVLLCGCETLMLNSDLKRHLEAFSTKCLRKFLGYCWDDIGLNHFFHNEPESSQMNMSMNVAFMILRLMIKART